MCDFFGGGGGGKTEYVTSQTSSEPWGPQQSHLKFGFNQARNIYNSDNPQYYPESTVVGFSPQSEMALSQTENRALAGSPLLQAGQQAMYDTASGNMLNSNPYFDQAVNNAMDPVQQRVMSQFNSAGRLGGGANQEVLARELGKVSSNMYASNYETERARQMQAAGMAPQMAQADYADMQRLAGVGAAREGLAQSQLQDDVNRWNFDQNREANKLGQYMALVGGGYGSTGSQTQPVYSNPASNFLGSAATGAGIGNMIGGTAGAGWGAGIGGLLGML